MRKLAGICVAMMIAGQAGAQALWQDAAFGDSEATLREKFPEIQAAKKPVKYDQGRVSRLFLDQRQIGDHVFDAHFVMDGDVLSGVHLVMGRKETGTIPFEVTFHDVEASLQRRYGEALYPLPAEMEDPDFLRLLKNEYREGGVVVTLRCVMCGARNGTLNISYEVSDASKDEGF